MDGVSGPVYDCATETSLAYLYLGSMRIILNSYLIRFSIYITVLMSNTLDGQINTYLTLTEMSL